MAEMIEPDDVQLTEDEWSRVYRIAGWYDGVAQQIGTTSPKNPLVCLLLAAESLHGYVESLGKLDSVAPDTRH